MGCTANNAVIGGLTGAAGGLWGEIAATVGWGMAMRIKWAVLGFMIDLSGMGADPPLSRPDEPEPCP
ncbi:hypothetical protein [Desulfonema magnum]|uniref:Uncharacterized protein n=1 Tax=Desulfonema magnum TaxID=45655 RepID=A0A975GKU3_9BACT|nr:hypothetical protein [Desulfonema magnum]QTA84148.1 Uncharacterized protein dnm_001410 [Desulfonema magnum]